MAWGDTALQGAPATVNSTVTGNENILPDDIVLFLLDSSTWLGLNVGRLRGQKREKKLYILPCTFSGGSHWDPRGIDQKVAVKKYSILKSTLQFLLRSKFSKYSMKHKPVLSEDEQFLFYWKTVAPKK